MTPRDPLQPLTLNASATSTGADASTPGPSSLRVHKNGSSSSGTTKYIPPSERKLAPIFTRRQSSSTAASTRVPSPTCTPPTSSPDFLATPGTPVSLERSGSSSSVATSSVLSDDTCTGKPAKRPRLELSEDESYEFGSGSGSGSGAGSELDSERELEAWSNPSDQARRTREEDVSRYFPPSTPTREGRRAAKVLVHSASLCAEQEEAEERWVIRRRRTGISAFRSSIARMDALRPTNPSTYNYLSSLIHTPGLSISSAPPQSIFLPSLHPPTGRERDYAPAIVVGFNNAAKKHDAYSAIATGSRRLVAAAGEEGGVRVVPIDESQHDLEQGRGVWWRAHANAIFDLKWSSDDTRMLTASGDQTSRLHAMDGSTPTLLASFSGHTSSVKTVTFFDPLGRAQDASKGSVIASAGRDGNIMIYDTRCAGWLATAADVADGVGGRRAGQRERYSAGVPGFTQQEGRNLDPVMVVRGAHAEGAGRRVSVGRSTARSVTSLVALQSMPGVLASGGATDGIVKLWDLRFPSPSTRHPDPKPTSHPSTSLPDPTLLGLRPSRRARGINNIVESPSTGDLYILTGDSSIHAIRPSACKSGHSDESAILPELYTAPSERFNVGNFFVRMAIDPEGRYLCVGNERGSVVAWDTRDAQRRGRAGDKRRGMASGHGNGEYHGSTARPFMLRIAGDESSVLDEAMGHSTDGAGAGEGGSGSGAGAASGGGDVGYRGRGKGFGSVDMGNGVIVAAGDDYAVRIWRGGE